MLRALMLLLTLLLPASALPLALAPPPAPPAPTPACAVVYPADGAALLGALRGADYACTEQVAAALRPLASAEVVDGLLALARSTENAAARRNALRTLGRLAESPQATRAYELLQRSRAPAMQATLAVILSSERDTSLVQDAIWLADTFYAPAYQLQPHFERLSLDRSLVPAVRERAAAAVGRLIFVRPGPLRANDLAYALRALHEASPGVRAEAALLAWRLRADQFTPAVAAAVVPALAQALANEAPLAIAADEPGAARRSALHYVQPETTALASRVALARALDRWAPAAEEPRYAALHRAYLTLALPAQFAADGLLLRSSLPVPELRSLAEHSAATRAAALALLGPSVRAPIPAEPGASVTLLIFPSQAAYREYLRAFTVYNGETDGLYAEASATLYTYLRSPAQTEHTLVETLQHELVHAVTARHLFAGGWHDPGYHTEPKGWLDEGLAEAMTGAVFDRAGNGRLALRPRPLARLCARPLRPNLADLLAQRAGYDRFGRFDYDGAWALSYFLLTEHPQKAQQLYAAYRDGSYRLANWPQIAGFASVAAAQAEWHGAIGAWCQAEQAK